MTLPHALILGIVEGLTEFLPISSTAHLILVAHMLGIQENPLTPLFEVVIQGGAIMAVILLFFRLILQNCRYVLLIFVSFIPTALIGIIFYDIIKNVFFSSTLIITSSLFVVGVLFFLVEYVVGHTNHSLHRTLSSMTMSHAVIIGSLQSVAVIPGVSRAGAVIIAMFLLQYRRSDAVIYSFLLAVPTILGASFFDLLKTDPLLVSTHLVILIVGSLMAFVSAIFAISLFIEFVKKHTLVFFGWYRILLAITIIVINICHFF